MSQPAKPQTFATPSKQTFTTPSHRPTMTAPTAPVIKKGGQWLRLKAAFWRGFRGMMWVVAVGLLIFNTYAVLRLMAAHDDLCRRTGGAPGLFNCVYPSAVAPAPRRAAPRR